MTQYNLIYEEAVWTENVYNEELERVATRQNEVVEGNQTYIWIEAKDRDMVVTLYDFRLGEEIIQKLNEGEYETLEEVCEDNEEASLENSPYSL